MARTRKNCNNMLKIVFDTFLLMKDGEAGFANVMRYIESSDNPVIKDNISSSVRGLVSYAAVSLREQGILRNGTINKGMVNSIGHNNVLDNIIKHKREEEKAKSNKRLKIQHKDRSTTTRKIKISDNTEALDVSSDVVAAYETQMPDVPIVQRTQIASAIALGSVHTLRDSVEILSKGEVCFDMCIVGECIHIYRNEGDIHYTAIPLSELRRTRISLGMYISNNSVSVGI